VLEGALAATSPSIDTCAVGAYEDGVVGAVVAGERDRAALESLPVPTHYRGVVIRAHDFDTAEALSAHEHDPVARVHVDEVPTPAPAHDEALVAVFGSSVNYNTVWSAAAFPVSTFELLRRHSTASHDGARHDLPYHVLGSDMAGVVIRTGAGVRSWRPGDEVVAHCLVVGLDGPDGHNDTLLDPSQRIWGYETNFGGLAELALVKANQLMPKPAHLTWEEAACSSLVNSTAYRQLISANGAQMKLGDVVLIWGAAGGLGSYATQLAQRGGAIPVCVVSSADKAAVLREMGVSRVIDRAAEGYEFWQDERTPDLGEWRRFGRQIRELTDGADPDIVFEHPGRETFGVSVFVCRRGGTVVTCASTSGFVHEYDNRYLWMHVKRIVGSHFANYREAWEANRLIEVGYVYPTLSRTYALDETRDALQSMKENRHFGKLGILCLATHKGLGVTDQELRQRRLREIMLFRHMNRAMAHTAR
jgi:crotonyl-CoA reductase